MSMTAAGWPSAAARLTNRPSPIRYSQRPLAKQYPSTLGRTFFSTFFATLVKALTSISTSKWPELHRIAPSFICRKCSLRITPVSPVKVMNSSPSWAASRIGMTRNPAIASHHHCLTGQQDTGCAQHPVQGGLAGAVAVVEEVLGIRVVDRDHWQL